MPRGQFARVGNSAKPQSRPKGGGSFAPLDGLRAMAVIWVLLYHVAKAPLKGAFLGPPTEPKPYIDNW